MPPPILSSLSTNNLIVDFPQEVTNALNGCKKLQPLTHLEVKNVSCYYYMRKKLRPKRHGNVSVKFNENTQKFDGFIYDLKRREEDLKIAPKKCLVASENDRWSAYKACEEALKERDKQKPIMEDEDIESRRPPKVLNLATHLQITVVSEKFVRVPPMGRLWMIYEALLESLGITADVQNPQSLYFCAPSSMKFTSTFGSQVTQLPFFQFLPFTIPNVHPTTTKFLFIPLTPAQWRPELYQPILSERIGQTRNFLTTIQMDPYTKPIIQKKRIQKLTTAKETSTSTSALFSKPAKKPSKKQSNLPKRVMNESLGLDQTVSGVTYNQVGGIYGHFFEDLSVSVKDMVLLRYEDNKDLIRRECHGDPTKGSSANDKDNYLADPHKIIADMEAREKASMGKPKTNATRFQTKSQKEASYEHTGEPDKGTNNTSEMKEHILISNKLIEWMAIRMQRMYRVYVFQKIMKKYWKSHYAAMQIQRIIRGKFARKYCSLLTVLQPFAVKKIQKFYRAIRSYCIRKHWHAMVYRLTRVVLPIIKDFIKRCYESWMSKRILSARKITNLIRMYLAKCITYKRHGQRVFFQLAFPKAATKIQAQIRRYLMVKWYQTIYIPECLHTLVDIPAAIRIQRIARGRLAKKQLKYLKYRYKCLVYLQRKLSEYVAKRWAKELAYEQRRQDSAILIQRRYRGHYDRKLFRLKYYFYWYHHIYIPNIIYVQSIVRCFLAKRYVGFLRVRHNAARTIQTGYRNYLKYQDFKRRKAELLKAFRQKSIICIQKYFRRFLQYKKFARLIQMERGRQLFAAKLIFRCWKNYQYKLRWEVMLNEFRNQQEKKQIDELAILKEDIREDIKEIKHDLGIAQRTKIRLKERLKEIDVFMTQCALRLQTISREMDKLTMEDFEQGWAEALGQEYEYLSYQSLHAREEIRLLRHKLYLTEEEILSLQLEYEEQEIELDIVDVKSIATMHGNHLREIETAEKQAQKHWQKMIFREKVHWKIESNRSARVFRHRKHNQDVIAASKLGRTIDFYTTIDYDKKKRREDYEHFIQQEQFENDARERDRLAKPKTYESYATKMQTSYDQIVARNLSLLRGFTLDERGKRLRKQYQVQEVKNKKRRKGQFAALKEIVE